MARRVLAWCAAGCDGNRRRDGDHRRLPDPETLAEVLDVRYEPMQGASDAWTEMYEVAPGDDILRAVLTLDREAGRLTVDTHSEPRLDRVLATLEGAGWDIDILEESRRPLDVDEMPRPPRGLPDIGGVPVGLAGATAPFLGTPLPAKAAWLSIPRSSLKFRTKWNSAG